MLHAAAQRLEAQKLIVAAVALALLVPTPTCAQAAPPAAIPPTAADPSVRAQADALLPVLAGQPGYADLFSPAFRTAVSQASWDTLTGQLRTALGAPRAIATLVPNGRWAATLTLDYERGTVTMLIAIDPAAPHQVTGLRITGSVARDDSAAKITADLAALPGTARIGVYALDGGDPAPVLAVNDGAPMPLGSAFKLWVLAEAARQVATGARHWDDVVPVGAPSLPSGILQGWPRGAPVTLQTLATLMISISDNSATDTLIGVLGRDRVDAMAARFGATGPVLTTREAFAIKADPTLTAAWAAANAAGRRALLAARSARIGAAMLHPMMFSAGPVANDTVEWTATPRDMARLLAHLRDAGPVVRDVLAINHGVDPVTVSRFGYVGFKGGSEPGVIALTLLAQTKSGRWLAVCAGWHRPDAAVDEERFVALVTRALSLLAE